MIYLIASDIHGSAPATGRLLDIFTASGADRLILLGDILYHGPRNDLPAGYAPKQVIAMLNPLARSILCVRGNCDAEVDQMVLDFPIMAEYAILSIERLGNRLVYLTHGHRDLPPLSSGDIVLSGHTHIPVATREDGIYRINPGSIALPKGGNPPSYALYEEGTFTIRSMEGNILTSIAIEA